MLAIYKLPPQKKTNLGSKLITCYWPWLGSNTFAAFFSGKDESKELIGGKNWFCAKSSDRDSEEEVNIKVRGRADLSICKLSTGWGVCTGVGCVFRMV
jgi:hypothetical protein